MRDGNGRKRVGKKLKGRMSAFNSETVVGGSVEQVVYVSDLMDKMTHYQADFTKYSKNMELYLDRRKLEQSMMKRNYDYCRNVIDMCVHPLSHGVNSGTVLECIGTYVGMSLVNPELRKQCNDHVVSMLYPTIERLGRSVENTQDRIHANVSRRIDFIESKTGHKLPFGIGDKIRNMPYNYSTQNERMLDLHDRAMKVRNYGRVPLTPETAGMMRLNFAMQYYYAIREPGADMAALQKQYQSAQDTLNGLAEIDHIPEEEINRNARLLVTQFASIPGHEDLAVMFEDVAYGDVKQSDGKFVTRPDGSVESRWMGEYETVDGEEFKDWFSVRSPESSDDMVDYMTGYYSDIYSGCETFADVVRVFGTPEFKSSCDLFRQMIRDDMPYMQSKNKTFVKDEDMLAAAQRAAGAAWANEHPGCQQEMDDFITRWHEESVREQSRRFGFDFDAQGEDDGYDYS